MKSFLVLIPLLAATALAQTPAPETVTVTGTGRVSLQPDRYTFTAGVQTQAASVEDAVNENNTRVSAVVAALKKAGAADADIRTSGFSIYPQQDYQQGHPPRVVGYQVTNNITVTRKQIGDAGKLLQAAISAGVNTASGLTFDVSDPRRGRDEVLKAAVEDARAKAAVLAAAAGRTLGRAITINEMGSQAPPPPRPQMLRNAAVAEAVSVVPVESGAYEVTSSVMVVFELK
jgi:uncharacterized protein YggE